MKNVQTQAPPASRDPPPSCVTVTWQAPRVSAARWLRRMRATELQQENTRESSRANGVCGVYPRLHSIAVASMAAVAGVNVLDPEVSC